MERIKYRITLDTHKTGIQRTLQGFETADNMARVIEINLTASGDTYEIPLDSVVAMMYVTTPSASEPSINKCVIEDNTILYDVLPIVEEGITEMQLKLIHTSIDGARKVITSPKFVVEVTDSVVNDESAEKSTTFTALEDAVAKAEAVYASRLLRIEIDNEYTFKAYYADGTVYENDFFNYELYNRSVELAESWAKGGTGVRTGEDTNNSMYFSNVSKSSALEAKAYASLGKDMAELAAGNHPAQFGIDYEEGTLNYNGTGYTYFVDERTGHLVIECGLIEDTLVELKTKVSEMESRTGMMRKLNALSGTVRDIVKNGGAKSNYCRVTEVGDGYITIRLVNGNLNSSIRLYTDDSVRKYEVARIGGYGVDRTSLYSARALKKSFLNMHLDRTRYPYLDPLLAAGFEFNECIITYQVPGDYTLHNIVLVINHTGFTIHETVGREDELYNGFVKSDYLEETFVHGNTCFFTLDTDDRLFTETIEINGCTAVRRFDLLGGGR